MVWLIVLAAVIVVLTSAALWHRHRERAAGTGPSAGAGADETPPRDDEPGPSPADRRREPAADERAEPGDELEPSPDPLGPPAAIRISVSGTHPWAPARLFIAELQAHDHDVTVELPDLMVLRDGQRRPVTIREPPDPPGQLLVTANPEKLADTLEVLVRALLTDVFTLEATDGRDVHLTDGDGVFVHLTVTELSRV